MRWLRWGTLGRFRAPPAGLILDECSTEGFREAGKADTAHYTLWKL